MRNLGEVIDRMLEVVPESAAELRLHLTWLRRDISYKAPEQMLLGWNSCKLILESCIGPPETDWEKKIQRIFNDTERDTMQEFGCCHDSGPSGIEGEEGQE